MKHRVIHPPKNMKEFDKIPRWLINADLSPQAFKLAVFIMTHVATPGGFEFHNAKLMKVIGVSSYNTLSKYIKELKRRGILLDIEYYDNSPHWVLNEHVWSGPTFCQKAVKTIGKKDFQEVLLSLEVGDTVKIPKTRLEKAPKNLSLSNGGVLEKVEGKLRVYKRIT